MADHYVIRPESLDRPFSFMNARCNAGDIVTLRQFIAALSSSFVLEDFGIAAAAIQVRPIVSLNDRQRKKLALSELRTEHEINPNQKLPVTGFGSYTPDILIREVTRNSPIGQKVIEGVILQAMLIESKIIRGHIRPSIDAKRIRHLDSTI